MWRTVRITKNLPLLYDCRLASGSGLGSDKLLQKLRYGNMDHGEFTNGKYI